MNNENNKNILDKFLDAYEDANNASKLREYKRIYQRPSKFKCITGLIFTSLIFIVLISIFQFRLLYFIILLIDLLAVLYYGVNLFTKKGFGLPKYVKVDEYTKNDDLNDRYKVQ